MDNKEESYKNNLKALLEEHKRLNVQEEQFNVFTTLRKESDEVYLHSRFISSILDPKGNLGLGDRPLNDFLKEIGSKFHITGKTEVIPNSKDWTERKEIDVFIGNLGLEGENEKCAIIIENKIYATDGDRQLETYFDKVTKEFGYKSSNIEVYYLTLDRHKPSDNSLGETLIVEGEDHNRIKTVRCIEYKTEIVNWLTKIKKSANGFLLNAIEQYLALVTKLTCDVDYNKELTEFVCENWEKTKEIVLNKDNKYPENEYDILRKDFKHVYWHIVTIFLEILYEKLLGEGLKIEIEKPIHESVTEIVHRKKRKPFKYSFMQNGTCWVLQADEHRTGNGFFIGYGYNSERKKWSYIHYIKDDNEKLLVDLWDCLNDETKGTETIETILKNKDSIIRQYVSIVKSELGKFGTKK